MSPNANEFHHLSAEEIKSTLDGVFDYNTNRVVGYYGEAGASLPAGFGTEGLYFRGVDTKTGQLVEAYYAGVTGGVGTSVSAGGGTFRFTGEPKQLSGWSVGAQATGVLTQGVSISTGEGNPVLHTYGANVALGVNISGGYTYKVSLGGEQIYGFFGPIEKQKFYEKSFDGAQYDKAIDSLGSVDKRGSHAA